MSTDEPVWASIDESRAGRLRPADLAQHLPKPATQRWPQGEFDFTVLNRADGAAVLFFAPRGEDHQQSHDRDEIYVVISGQGQFVIGDAKIDYRPGDLLYVPRNVSHHFAAPPADLALWVVFLPV